MSQTVHAKFMTNLLRKPMHHTRYVGALKPVTPDPYIPTSRMVFGMVGGAVTIIVTMLIAFSLGAQLFYIWPGVLALLVGGLLLSVLYMIPFRSQSVLSLLLSASFSRFSERVRLRTDKQARLRSAGIAKLSKSGLMVLDSGHYGRLYKVEGQLSRSTLPEVVKLVNNARYQHIVGRSAGSGEKLITMISRIDLSELLDYYRQIHEHNLVGPDTPEKALRRAMVEMDYSYVKSTIHLKKTDVRQYLMVTDLDKAALDKTVAAFEQAVASEMLASATRLSGEQVLEVLSPMVLSEKR